MLTAAKHLQHVNKRPVAALRMTGGEMERNG